MTSPSSRPWGLDQKIDAATAIIDEAMARYPKHAGLYALVSGGKDSTGMATLVAALAPRLDAVVHVNTGIGIEETREYTRDFASWLDAPLHEFHPPVSYRDIVLEHGFPGPGAHSKMYSRLKERALRQARAMFQTRRGQPVIFLTGVRKDESQRRMGNVSEIQADEKNGKIIWVAPLLDFDMADLMALHRDYGIPHNEVTSHLHMSGECLCGAFAHEGELDEIGMFFPHVAKTIRGLEAEVRALGRKSALWGPSQYPGYKGVLRPQSPGMLCKDCELPEEVPNGESL